MNIFNGINEKDLEKLLKCLDAKNISFKKGSTIINNASNTNILSIITKGSASIIRIDYNGNKTIIENLKENDIVELLNSKEYIEIYNQRKDRKCKEQNEWICSRKNLYGFQSVPSP